MSHARMQMYRSTSDGEVNTCRQGQALSLSPGTALVFLVTVPEVPGSLPDSLINSRFSRPEPLLSLPSSFSIVLTRLSGPRYSRTASQEIW
jgi:hypothetical protein